MTASRNIRPKTLRYSDLIDCIKARFPFVSSGAAGACLEALTAILREAALEGTTVELRGYGRFVIKPGAARHGFNPGTKVPMTIPAKNRIRFVPDPTVPVKPLV